MTALLLTAEATKNCFVNVALFSSFTYLCDVRKNVLKRDDRRKHSVPKDTRLA